MARADALAELAAVVTDHDDRSAAKLRRPIVYGIVGAANRAGDEPRIGRKIIVGPHVYERRTFWSADEACKLFRSDAVD